MEHARLSPDQGGEEVENERWVALLAFSGQHAPGDDSPGFSTYTFPYYQQGKETV